MGISAIKRDDNSYEGEEKEKNEALKRKRRLWKDKCKHIGGGGVLYMLHIFYVFCIYIYMNGNDMYILI